MFAASKTDSVSDGGYQISRSLRFNSADSASLSRTPATATNRRTFTWSAWVKRGTLGSYTTMFSGYGGGGGPIDYISFDGNNAFLISAFNGGDYIITTLGVFRDPSAWYHLVVAVDTTQATSTNRIKLYVNGVNQEIYGSYPTQNYETQINNNVIQYVGSNIYNYWNGYMTEVNFIDGQALTPSSFGETNVQTGVWQPKAYSGSYGTNGFYLNFSDNSNTTAATLGKDYSGNGNNWTPNNFSVSAGAGNDSMIDVPTPYGVDTGAGGTVRGNYSTFNPIGLGGGTLTNGNLDLSITVSTPSVGTFAMTTGKWYWEIICNTVSAPRIGVYDIGSANPTNLGATAFGWCLINAPSRTYNNNSAPSYGAFSPTTGTVVMVAYDADAGNLWFGQDGTFFASGVPSTGANPSMSSVTGKAIVPALAHGSAGTDTFSANFGQRPFAYTAPSGFKALCTQNLPTPTIGATTPTQAGKFFNPVIYTGAGGSQSITGIGFQPDFVWMKGRNTTTGHILQNVVTGVTKGLQSNTTASEFTDNTTLTAFNSDGYTVNGNSQTNASGTTYVAWNWKANGAGSTNTAGTITSTVSANTTSGFSVVTYTGNSTSGATVGHGLGIAPSMVIVKGRNAEGLAWCVYVSSLGASQYLFLNDTAAAGSYSGFWNNTSPTSTLLTLGNDNGTNGTSKTYVAYCFAPIAGYSAFGSYTGNGSADGPFVYTGFKPAFILYKRTSSAGNSWRITDSTRSTYNLDDAAFLYPDSSQTENTNVNDGLDILSNGFKMRTSNDPSNNSGSTYIYAAFASSPFKYSLAR
jgi:hypothetical protein